MTNHLQEDAKRAAKWVHRACLSSGVLSMHVVIDALREHTTTLGLCLSNLECQTEEQAKAKTEAIRRLVAMRDILDALAGDR